MVKKISKAASIIVTFCMLLTLFPMVSFATGEIVVNDFDSLKTALTTAYAGETITTPGIILVNSDIEITANITVSGKFKTLVANNNHRIFRSSAFYGEMFKINSKTVLNIGGVAGYAGVLTFDGASVTDTVNNAGCNAIINNSDNTFAADSSVVNIYSGNFTNNIGNGNGCLRIERGYMNFYGGTVSGNSTLGAYKNGGAFRMMSNAQLVIDGGTIQDNTCTDRGGAIKCDSASVVTFKSGLIKGNGGNGALDFANGGSTFNMYGGTIDGVSTLFPQGSENDVLNFQNSGTICNLYGGTIQNTYRTAINLADASVCNITTDNGSSGITFQNCGKLPGASSATATDGGAIASSGTINFRAGTIKDSDCTAGGGAIQIKGLGSLNLYGGLITNCGPSPIRHNGTTLAIYDGFKLPQTEIIKLENSNKKVTIGSTLTTNGAVANIGGQFGDLSNGQAILAGDATLVANNSGKFRAKTGVSTYVGVDTTGKVDNTLPAPDFVEVTASPSPVPSVEPSPVPSPVPSPSVEPSPIPSPSLEPSPIPSPIPSPSQAPAFEHTFTLYSSDNEGIVDPATHVINGNGGITAQPTGLIGGTTKNGTNGTAEIYIPQTDTLIATGTGPCWGKSAVKFRNNGPLTTVGAAVTYTPTNLMGVDTTVTYNGISGNGQYSAEISALVTYDGGKTATVLCYPSGASTGLSDGSLMTPKTIGTYKDLQSVKIYCSGGGGELFIYSVDFAYNGTPTAPPVENGITALNLLDASSAATDVLANAATVGSVKITSNTASAGTLIIAFYKIDNGNIMLAGVTKQNVTSSDFTAGVANINLGITIPADTTSVKAMYWDSMTTIKPIFNFISK